MRAIPSSPRSRHRGKADGSSQRRAAGDPGQEPDCEPELCVQAGAGAAQVPVADLQVQHKGKLPVVR
eukprot:366458-Chlamydomonas_euryale.AAC.30